MYNAACKGWLSESIGKKLLWIKVKSGVNDALENKVQ
jgi:hypothetical protein